MAAITKRLVTSEFRAEAANLVIVQGQSAADVARRLDIPYQTLYNWVVLAKAGKLAEVDAKRITPISSLEAELSRLKKEVAVLREERDILKKATAFFAKESR
jgi:transposase